MGFLIVVQAIILYVFTWVLWKVSRRYLLKSPLDNIPGPPSSSFVFGNLKEIDDPKDGWGFQEMLATKWNGVVRVKGIFNENILFVFDPKAAHAVLVKDQQIYENPPFRRTYGKLLLGDGLLAVAGVQHKTQRKLMNPLFSVAHMHGLFPTFTRVTLQLRDALRNEVQHGIKELDILNWLGRAALELVGQGGLGYSFDPLVEDVPNELGEAIKKIMPSAGGFLRYSELLSLLDNLGASAVFLRRLLEVIPVQSIQKTLQTVQVLHSGCEQIYFEKKTALAAGDDAVVHQVGEGKDIMSVLLKANIEAEEEDRLPENEVIGQMSTLMFAAVDTTSTSLTRVIELLAQKQDIQSRLREEILNALDGEEALDYDQLTELPYLDAIWRETLRLYAPVSMLFRATVEDTVMPLSESIIGIDGTTMKEIPIPKGTKVFVGVSASNQNTGLWGEDAKEWKPERWMENLPTDLVEARLPGVYAHLLTFGGGGRACIGFKFSHQFTLTKDHDKIFWNATRIASPSIGSGGKQPTMPINVELVERAH
ncbi:cytochrome P450 [Abortiporus biennis]|nr:cytochrome P450 [Abortiporus biennis]